MRRGTLTVQERTFVPYVSIGHVQYIKISGKSTIFQRQLYFTYIHRLFIFLLSFALYSLKSASKSVLSPVGTQR